MTASPRDRTGAVAAILVHVGEMYFPPTRAVLETSPIGLNTWMALIG
ncbi:hypothetical protein [Tautonia plasticadhaerens]|uniref:Uncharacterized protein n=1 Tax=Tautonia plasticadhaerens TaxID=2527974 RepID=A0A518H7C0_9BACT|nr:hypothetical protein [Tautonia plasticadhaerens]QDV36767.1 hypothetical protein ElP_46960 [Tautonia plasticadhaerens]